MQVLLGDLLLVKLLLGCLEGTYCCATSHTDTLEYCAWCSSETLQYIGQAGSRAAPGARRCLGQASAVLAVGCSMFEAALRVPRLELTDSTQSHSGLPNKGPSSRSGLPITSELSRRTQTQKMIGLQIHHCHWDLRQRHMILGRMAASGRERTVAKIGRTHPHHQDNGDQD